MDVAIVGDISKSMKSDHRSKLIVLVKSLVDKMGVSREGNHFAIASFGPYAAINTNFNNQNNYKAENLKRVVNQRFRVVPTKVGTRTDLILQKDVRVIAVGIGSGIDQPTLLSIAREKDQVVTVGGFSELADEMNTIKSKACSDRRATCN
ncbi:hypothetical protein pdam_00009828 [Pocillopora damicornis]|uniref:VWFA domain-containing protein n=1 Tax=Pocillopora damicornis TaxID=46731 RepID=A0A3M6UZM9_POCDA|nr:hypothetical protein pdam_00009828 [Pocillopora damicornis]